MRFKAKATLGNSHGIYDTAYQFGDQGELVGTPDELAREVARFLGKFTEGEVQALRYGAPHFFVELLVTPEGQPEDTIFTEGKP
jgi:hypothetical protein